MANEQPRRKADVAFIGVILTMILQFGGLVWGASALNSAVNELRRITARIEVSEARRDADIGTLQHRVGIVETRQSDVLRRVDILEDYHR